MAAWLRWCLVVPAACAAWYAALILAFGLYSVFEALCPPDQMVSGMCMAPWFDYAVSAVICTGAALAATFILIGSAVIAPSHKSIVVVATFIGGAVVAVVLGVLANAYFELLTSVAVGLLITIWLLRQSWVRSSSNNALERERGR
jgi:fucose permease